MFFPDMPHCMKNLRNHTLDSELVVKYPDQTSISLSKNDFINLLSCQTGDLTLCHKVTLAHLEVRGMDRQRVRPAMQLFSFTVAKAFIQLFGDKYKEQSKIIEVIDAWVDVMNSSHMYDRIKVQRCGLGKYQNICHFFSFLWSWSQSQ